MDDHQSYLALLRPIIPREFFLGSFIDEIVVGGPDDDPERVSLSGDAGFLIENIQALKAENPDQDDGSGLSKLSVAAGAYANRRRKRTIYI